MKLSFWLKRFLTVFVSAFIILTAVYLLRGRERNDALREALIWSSASASLYLAIGMVYARRGLSCALCNDLPSSSTNTNSWK